jgi:prefoldin subunit 2
MDVTREHQGHSLSQHSIMSSPAAKSKSKPPALSDQGKCCNLPVFLLIDHPEIQQNFVRMQNELQALAGKIGELEQEADEHG